MVFCNTSVSYQDKKRIEADKYRAMQESPFSPISFTFPSLWFIKIFLIQMGGDDTFFFQRL